MLTWNDSALLLLRAPGDSMTKWSSHSVSSFWGTEKQGSSSLLILIGPFYISVAVSWRKQGSLTEAFGKQLNFNGI